MSETGGAFEEAMSILTMKEWADFDFDSFWERLKETWEGKKLHVFLSTAPEVKDRARKFYEKITTQWLEEELLSSPELADKALVQYIKMGMVYSFLFGYADRISRENPGRGEKACV